MSEYEKLHFEKWQDLAKAVIDGGEIYFKVLDYGYYKISFDGNGFNCDVGRVFRTWGTYIKKQPTLEESIPIKPRLCWVSEYDDFTDKGLAVITVKECGYYKDADFNCWEFAKLVELNEIKQYLGDDNEQT